MKEIKPVGELKIRRFDTLWDGTQREFATDDNGDVFLRVSMYRNHRGLPCSRGTILATFEVGQYWDYFKSKAQAKESGLEDTFIKNI